MTDAAQRTLHASLEIEEACPRCSGVGEELANCVSDSAYGSDRLSRLQSTLARQIVYHLQLGYGITVTEGQALDVAAQQCAAVTEWMRGSMTLSDQLISALASDPGLSPEEVVDWAVRYEDEAGDASLRGVTAEELMLMLSIPHQPPGSGFGSSSMSGSGSGSWSGSRSRSWSWLGSRSRSRSSRSRSLSE